jgi:hypothetical protein
MVRASLSDAMPKKRRFYPAAVGMDIDDLMINEMLLKSGPGSDINEKIADYFLSFSRECVSRVATDPEFAEQHLDLREISNRIHDLICELNETSYEFTKQSVS